MDALKQKRVQASLKDAAKALERGDAKTAASCYRAVLRYVPGHPLALRFLGSAARQAGQGEQAVEMLAAAVAAAPMDAGTRLDYAHALLATNRLDEAQTQLLCAQEQGSPSAEGFVLLAKVQERRGQMKEMLATLQAATQAFPQDWRGHMRLGAALAGGGGTGPQPSRASCLPASWRPSARIAISTTHWRCVNWAD